mmetsp:Transcript_11059/g.27112  ORF Transcript_11059/g.27112 Transcript_11059/m.27112 type:complete len:216 (+) Transcript_11059:922-1569(+)
MGGRSARRGGVGRGVRPAGGGHAQAHQVPPDVARLLAGRRERGRGAVGVRGAQGHVLGGGRLDGGARGPVCRGAADGVGAEPRPVEGAAVRVGAEGARGVRGGGDGVGQQRPERLARRLHQGVGPPHARRAGVPAAAGGQRHQIRLRARRRRGHALQRRAQQRRQPTPRLGPQGVAAQERAAGPQRRRHGPRGARGAALVGVLGHDDPGVGRTVA